MKKCWEDGWKKFAKSPYFKPNRLVVDEIVKLIDPKNKKILEVGAGSGSDSIVLVKMGAKVSVVDFSPESIKVCQILAKKEDVELKTFNEDCRRMSFPDNHFDVVFSVGLVEHFHNPTRAITEQLRVLKKGGYLIIDVPQKFNLYTLVKKIRMKNGSFPFGWETEYSYFDLVKISKKFNVEIISFFGHDSAFTLKLPQFIRPIYKGLFSIVENSPLAPFICLCIGVVLKKNE